MWGKVVRSGPTTVDPTQMLLGEYEHTIDDKNRLTLPAKFRQAFGDGVVLTRGLDGCVFAYRRADWARLVESRLAPLDPLRPDTRQLQRHFFAGAAEDAPDKQGRVTMPAHLVKHANLGREVTVVGVHDHLEIWDRSAWRTELERVEGSAEDVAERLATQHD
jgi:MraZ protein